MSKQFCFKLFNLAYKNGSISNNSVEHKYAVLLQTIQFCIITQFSSIWTINRALSGSTTLGQSGSRSDGNEGVLWIPQRSSINRTSPSDCWVSYLGLSLENLTLLKRSSRCFLQSQPTGQYLYCIYVLKCVYISKNKVGDRCRGRPEGSLFDSYNTKV